MDAATETKPGRLSKAIHGGLSKMTVIDTTADCSKVAAQLKRAGYDTVIRYYSLSEWKRLSQREAIVLGRNGIRIGVVYQNRQDRPEDFTSASGEEAARSAADYARNVIFQPKGSAIYFAVDFDASQRDTNANVVQFFQGVQRIFALSAGAVPDYRVGVYGSGRVCRTIVESGLAQFAWLAQSTGWSEYDQYFSGKQWHLKQDMPATICGLDCDPDETNSSLPDFGSFLLEPDSLGPAAPPPESESGASRFTVVARDGLRLRSGPSTEFDIRSVLPFGTAVRVLSRNGDWALVDMSDDGAADGFCHADFLRPL